MRPSGELDAKEVTEVLRGVARRGFNIELDLERSVLSLPGFGPTGGPTLKVKQLELNGEGDGVEIKLSIPKKPRGASHGDTEVRRLLKASSDLRKLLSSPGPPHLQPDINSPGIREGSYAGEILISWPLHKIDMKGAEWPTAPVQLVLELMANWVDADHETAVPSADDLLVHDVMFSFNEADREIVDSLDGILSATGSFASWRYDVNKLKTGDHVLRESQAAVRRSRVVVPILSSSYWESEWCPQEFWYAVTSEECDGLEVLPALVESDGIVNVKDLLGWNLSRATKEIPARMGDQGPSTEDVKRKLSHGGDGAAGLLGGEVLVGAPIAATGPEEADLRKAAEAISDKVRQSREDQA